MIASSLLTYYKDQVPHVKVIQSIVQVLMVGYFFLLLLSWQDKQQERNEAAT